jgi:hypothetical protein
MRPQGPSLAPGEGDVLAVHGNLDGKAPSLVLGGWRRAEHQGDGLPVGELVGEGDQGLVERSGTSCLERGAT